MAFHASSKSFAAALAGALAVVLATSGAASAQSSLLFSWQPPQKVFELMEKEKMPGLFFFEAYDELKHAYNSHFGYAPFQAQAKKYACAKIQGQLGGSSKMWGQYQKYADKWGVGTTSTIVLVSYDGMVMGTISSAVKRDALAAEMNRLVAFNKNRVEESNRSERDLEQVGKWIEEEKYADAVRRTRMVIDRGDKISPKVLAKAEEYEKKLKEICTAKLEEAKKLAEDPSKKAEAKAALQEIASAFAKYDEAKEARSLLKKLD